MSTAIIAIVLIWIISSVVLFILRGRQNREFRDALNKAQQSALDSNRAFERFSANIDRLSPTGFQNRSELRGEPARQFDEMAAQYILEDDSSDAARTVKPQISDTNKPVTST